MLFCRATFAMLVAVFFVTPVYAITPPPASNLIHINTDMPKDLLKMKGLNASQARAILMYREKYGKFKTPADLVKVRGFNKLSADELQKLEAQITVQ